MRATRLAVLGLLAATAFFAQNEDAENQAIALVYHKLTGDPLDLQTVAQSSNAVRSASGFDRPDAVKTETARLQAQLNSSDPGKEFVMRVNDSISEYDHQRGEFYVVLFRPGYFVPVNAFRQQYQLVFANVEGARAIPMPKEEARAFDLQLQKISRHVTNEIHFKVIGKGDPAGGVTGERVIRAEILSSRLLDGNGNVVYLPRIVPLAASAPAAPFDLAKADVAGFRVGVKVSDLEATLARTAGKPQRVTPKNGVDKFAGTLEVNSMGCASYVGRRSPNPGAVCVTAYFDKDEIVRAIRVERLFPWFDSEIFRKSLTQKYGAVASAKNSGSGLELGWGPEVNETNHPEKNYFHSALRAQYAADEDFMSRGMNSLPRIKIVLHLVDAQWASQR
ncbi:DUF4852 domain-containing protein [Paludibaculum fermentans]|uniref:DUF4852 domain-containing protein n=1 Tax=Paludibaculum fermentans TaxID=1473598 RepID=A0A7S7NKY7_PALFE|nr:DUF4852 domain-containing protein [Paludibaculum fermentans]QOY85565.1 DUF4852 domain-containing protein [Paludibaculum fermentans]